VLIIEQKVQAVKKTHHELLLFNTKEWSWAPSKIIYKYRVWS